VGYGTIDTAPDMILPERLKKIHNDLGRVITQYQPKALVMENVFFFKNAKTIVPVCQAQGVILLAAAKKGLPVYRYTPIEVKMTITGFVKSDKKMSSARSEKFCGWKKSPNPTTRPTRSRLRRHILSAV
jgi:Holliday junction resolvasome, endonuclease subunit